VDKPAALAYFEIHEEADKAHREAWRAWLNEHSDSGSNDEVVATAKEALNALWGALDAVHRSRN